MYSLRKLAVAAVLGGVAFVPAASFAGTPVDCNASPVETSGQGRTPDSKAGVCIEGLGYVEVGTNADKGGNEAYVVAESDQFGYVAATNYENGAKSNCDPSGPDGNEGGTGTNSGGCVGTNGNAVQTGLPIGCGDGTGPWYSSSRDGCRVDAEDVDDLIAEINDLLP